ncbi:MAG: microcystin degradation protein MlrC [Cryomorphaceae bacterium]|nr:MAG: microcystin degradation protein MlrC [Cryomorphaceae bacterium]
MKIKQLLYFISITVLFSCNTSNKKLRIGITGLAIESSTFSPAITTEKEFDIRYGGDIFRSYPFFDQNYMDNADWFPTMRARALPGGVVSKESYESMVLQIIELTKQTLPLDGLFFDIHGAMNVEGMDDPEGDFIERIRSVIGNKTMISTSMDSHGNVSETLALNSDIITCYRKAPHTDALESKQRALDNLIERLKSVEGKPKYKAWIPVPILLPGEQTSTRVEPGKSLYEKVKPIADSKGVVDAAIWVGYAWGDAPRNHAVVMTVGDNKNAVVKGAEELAKSFWDARDEFDFVAPTTTLNDALSQAFKYLKNKKDNKPFIISDMGDNPTAGGAGDVTWTLDKLLKSKEFKSKNGPEIIYASIPGPDLIKNALNTKIGEEVSGYVGAIVDNRFSPPILLNGTLRAVHLGDKNAEAEVVVQVGSIKVIVTNKRKPYHYISDFTNLSLNPSKTDILMVKIGYLVPELYDIRGDWVMALTPGGVDQDLERLGYKNIKRPMFPLDKDMEDPDLSAVLIPVLK